MTIIGFVELLLLLLLLPPPQKMLPTSAESTNLQVVTFPSSRREFLTENVCTYNTSRRTNGVDHVFHRGGTRGLGVLVHDVCSGPIRSQSNDNTNSLRHNSPRGHHRLDPQKGIRCWFFFPKISPNFVSRFSSRSRCLHRTPVFRTPTARPSVEDLPKNCTFEPTTRSRPPETQTLRIRSDPRTHRSLLRARSTNLHWKCLIRTSTLYNSILWARDF